MASQPELNRRYTTSFGNAAVFRMPSGALVTLEPHAECVALGWTDSDIRTIAGKLGELASDESNVHIAQEHDIAKLESPNILEAVIRRSLDESLGLEMVRIETPEPASTILWLAEDGELSVVAPSWEAAATLATGLDASDVANALPGMVQQL